MQFQAPLIPLCQPLPLQPVPCNNFLQPFWPLKGPVVKETNASDDQPPDGYIFVNLLGQGSFGKVYLTKHLSSQQFCAVKYATQTYWNPQSQVNVKALTKEYNLLRQISHKNIVSCLGLLATVDYSKWCLFLEYMDMGSIRSVYERNGRPLDEKFVQYITKEVWKGLHFLHLNGIVHRDIKGDNILLNSAYMIKIADFGIAKFVYPVPQEGLGLETKMMGTLSHMAPEIRLTNCSKSNDSSVDIWSLGCTILEMLTGDVPQISFIFYNINMDFRCNYNMPQDITDTCSEFIECTLSEIPEDRPKFTDTLPHPWISA